MKILDEFLTMQELMDRWGVNKIETIIKTVENGLRVFAYVYCSHGEFENKQISSQDIWFNSNSSYFYMDDILKYEADNGKGDDTGKACKPLTANALLKEPIFQETMDALKTILSYCESNRPGKKEDVYTLFCKKHNSLAKQIFDKIWGALPAGIKRERGQRDHN